MDLRSSANARTGSPGWTQAPGRVSPAATSKRLRYFPQRDSRAVSAGLQILLRLVAAALRPHSPGASPAAQLGAVNFVHRFGGALNAHGHFHLAIIDGGFEAADTPQAKVRFYPAGLSPADLEGIQARVRQRVLSGVVRHGYLDQADAKEMGQWGEA